MGTGNHKGCLYGMFAGGYFHSNRSCRLPLAPPGTKIALVMGTGNHKGCPYDEVCRGLFSEESLMSAAADTTKHENTEGFFQGNDR